MSGRDDELSPDRLRTILARALALGAAAKDLGGVATGPSCVRVLCPDVIVFDLRGETDATQPSSAGGPIRVFAHDVTAGKRVELGALLCHRRRGAYEARLVYLELGGGEGPVWKIVASRGLGLGAAVLSYFSDRSGACVRRFGSATEDDLRQALEPNRPGGGCEDTL
jgi:hypothetical protein